MRFRYCSTTLTVVMRRHHRHGWASHVMTKQATLRAMRDGLRASSWRPDPSHEPDPEDPVLRILVTEQTRAGGKRAGDRLQSPDLHLGADAVVLTTYVTPRSGYQTPGAAPETPALVELPEPLGGRQLIDGAVFGPVPVDES